MWIHTPTDAQVTLWIPHMKSLYQYCCHNKQVICHSKTCHDMTHCLPWYVHIWMKFVHITTTSEQPYLYKFVEYWHIRWDMTRAISMEIIMILWNYSYALWLVPLGSVHWKEKVAVEPHMEEQFLLGLTSLRAVGAGVPVDLTCMWVGNIIAW